MLISFGEAVRDARLKQGVSQEELAFSAGFDRTYISLIERGKRNPSLVTIGKIAIVLNVRLVDLVSRINLIPTNE